MIKKIYFMGIKGVGMASLAIIAKEAGFIIAGSDVDEEFITDQILSNAKIEVRVGFKSVNVEEFFGTSPIEESLFIATGAHEGFDNVECEFARSKNIKTMSHGEAVGLFMSGELFERSDIEGISVAGSHGKTTIAAMIATLLERLTLDPSYTVGTSEINPIGAAGHYGKGKYFIAEADEYLAEGKYARTPKFLYQHPKYLIINNIDFDHPDFYSDINKIRDAFGSFIANLGPSDTLIVNGDDENIKKLIAENLKLRTITYGTRETNEFVIKNYKQEGMLGRFEVFRGSTPLGKFELSIPGYHNAKNSLAAISLLIELGISVRDIQGVLPQFLGSKRRLERIGETENGALLYDDYAHHPEEIRKTLEALKNAYPAKKITLVFQAHTFARTRALSSEFASSFAGARELIILPTFASARDSIQKNIEEDRDFVEKIRTIQPNVKLIESVPDVVEYINKNITSGSILLTMGAGDVYKITQHLKLKK